MKTYTENQSDINFLQEVYEEQNTPSISDVFDSYINGCYEQAKSEVIQILEKGRNPFEESEETRLEAEVDHNYLEGFDLWLGKTASKIIAGNYRIDKEAIKNW
jgi:hypothetical protein